MGAGQTLNAEDGYFKRKAEAALKVALKGALPSTPLEKKLWSRLVDVQAAALRSAAGASQGRHDHSRSQERRRLDGEQVARKAVMVTTTNMPAQLEPGAYWYLTGGNEAVICEKRAGEDFVRFTNCGRQTWVREVDRFVGPLAVPVVEQAA
jgi:hypothetical protein